MAELGLLKQEIAARDMTIDLLEERYKNVVARAEKAEARVAELEAALREALNRQIVIRGGMNHNRLTAVLYACASSASGEDES